MPGPGVYRDGNIETVKKANPKWSIKGKGIGEKYEKSVPGPGQYNGDYK